MDTETFSKVLNYLQFDQDDRRALALQCLFVGGMTKSEAARIVDMTPANLGSLVDRALRDLRRAGDLTGVYINPIVRHGIRGRKAKHAE